jgi:hypothetical protein
VVKQLIKSWFFCCLGAVLSRQRSLLGQFDKCYQTGYEKKSDDSDPNGRIHFRIRGAGSPSPRAEQNYERERPKIEFWQNA